MTTAKPTPDNTLLVAIDIAKHRNEVLIEEPGRARRRRMSVLNNGEGEPIVVLAGELMPIRTTAQITGPLSQRRQVIFIDLEGHSRTGLRDSPMSHERNGDDIAAILRHLGIERADIGWTPITAPGSMVLCRGRVG